MNANKNNTDITKTQEKNDSMSIKNHFFSDFQDTKSYCIKKLKESKQPVNRKYLIENAEYICADKDEGLALLFQHLYNARIVYDVDRCNWYWFDGVLWRQEKGNKVLNAVHNMQDLLEERQKQLKAEKKNLDPKEDKGIINQIDYRLKLITKGIDRIITSNEPNKSFLKQAAGISQLAMSVNSDIWDKIPEYLPCANGIINMKTGELIRKGPKCAKFYMTNGSPVEWSGIETPCHEFRKFLLEILGDDEELLGYMQRLLGYAVSGHSNQAIWPIFIGQGRNGKDVLKNIMLYVLGSLASELKIQILGESKFYNADGATPEILKLRGLRMAFFSEPDISFRFDTGKIKALTGGNILTGRSLYDKTSINWAPTHTIFLISNHIPKLSETGFAIEKRMQAVSFPYSYVENPDPNDPRQKKADTGLAQRIIDTEASGILAWLVRGYHIFLEKGLAPPDKVLNAATKMLEDQDVIKQFINARLQVTRNQQDIIPQRELFSAYQEWFESTFNEESKMGAVTLGRRLIEHGLDKQTKRHVPIFTGIQFKSNDE